MTNSISMPLRLLSSLLLFTLAFSTSEILASTLQPIASLHSILSRQQAYYANVSDRVTFTCQVCEARGVEVSVYWGRDDDAGSGVPAFVIGGKMKNPLWQAAQAKAVETEKSCGPGENPDGVRYDVTLTAEKLKVTDSGRWWCQLLPNKLSADWRFAYFSINVFGKLEGEEIILRANSTDLTQSSALPASIKVDEGSKTNLTCLIGEGLLNNKQNATVTWQIEGAEKPLAEDRPEIEYVADAQHFGKKLLCIVDYAAGPSEAAPSIVRKLTIDMTLKPRVALSAWNPAGLSVSNAVSGKLDVPIRSVLVNEGDSIELHCSPFNTQHLNSRALTGQETFKWSVKEASNVDATQLLYANDRRNIKLGPLGRDRDGAIVSCEVDNGRFIANSQLQIRIQYKLANTVESKYIGAKVGDVVTLDCTEGDIEADRFVASYKFVWFFGSLQIVSETKSNSPNNVLSFTLSNSSQFGNYKCLARNTRSGSQAVRSFSIIEKSKPIVNSGFESSIQLVQAIENYKVSIPCSVYGLPRPTSFKWYRRNSTEPLDNAQGEVEGFIITRKNSSFARTESVLTIYQVTDSDFDLFTCVADNEYGQAEMMFQLKKKVSLPLMEIVAAACGGFFTLAVLITVAVYFRCREQAPKQRSDSGANSLKLSETDSSGTSGQHDGASMASSGSEKRRESLTSPNYEQKSPVDQGISIISQGSSQQAITLPTLPHLMPSYHRYPDQAAEAGTNTSFSSDSGVVRLSASANDNFDDWLKQSRLATFSHLGAYQPSVSFRHPLPPIPPVHANEKSRLATDV